MKKLNVSLPVAALLLISGCVSTSSSTPTNLESTSSSGEFATALDSSEITISIIPSTDSTSSELPDDDSSIEIVPAFEIPGAFLQGGFRPVSGDELIIDETSFHAALPEGATVELDIQYSEDGRTWSSTDSIVDEGIYEVAATVIVGDEYQEFQAEYTLVDYEDLDEWYLEQYVPIFQVAWLLDQLHNNFTASWNYSDNYSDITPRDPRFHARTSWVTEEGVAYYGFTTNKGDKKDSEYALDTYPTATTVQEGRFEQWTNTYTGTSPNLDDNLTIDVIEKEDAAQSLEKFINYDYASSYDNYNGAFGLWENDVTAVYTREDGTVFWDLSDFELEEENEGLIWYFLNNVAYNEQNDPNNENNFFDLSSEAEWNDGITPTLEIFIEVIEDPLGNPALLITPEFRITDGSKFGTSGATYVWWMFDLAIYFPGETEFDYATAKTGDAYKQNLDPEEGGIWYRETENS
jgi:hypothetical protein